MNRDDVTTVSGRTGPESTRPPRVERAECAEYSVPLSATPRGARLARLLAAVRLEAWGVPQDPARLVVAELAANAVRHGRVPGRGFLLGLSVRPPGTLLVEVTDTRGDVLPARVPVAGGGAPAESGHGLVLVAALAQRWGVRCGPAPRKTVWAELDLAGR